MLTIRLAQLDDLPALTTLYNYYVENSHATFDLLPVTVNERRLWYDHFTDRGPYWLVVAEDDSGRVIGYANSSPFNPRAAYYTSVTTSIYIHHEAVGRGIGAALYTDLFARLNANGLHRAYAGIALPNAASIGLHRKFGFHEVGTYHEAGRKFDKFWSVTWFEKRLSE
ncbi:MAG: GNAT family N-acetyltransferase [Anaerolineae bacterium]